MTELTQIHFFADTSRFARRLAREIAAAPPVRIAEHRFPDGETLVRVHTPVARHAVLVRSLHDPNAKLVETLLAADALRRGGAKRITLVAPYLPYMRQDEVFHPGEPLSQRVVGNWLGSSFDRVLAIEAHLHRIARLGEVVSGVSLTAAPAIAGWLRRGRGGALVVGPDAESEPWVRTIAAAAGSPWIVGHKQRYADRSVVVTLPAVAGCRRAVIVDDIASSGVTLAATARALRRHGVTHIEAVVVHAIFASGAAERIRAAGVERVISCDTIPHPSNAIPCAALIAGALR